MTTNRTDTAANVQLGHYEIDTENSTVAFTTRHMFGLGAVRGRFAIRAGSVDVAEPITDSRVRVDIDTASFHTGNEQRDRNVRSARYLDTDRFPVMTFTAGQLRGTTLQGMLTVRDVTRQVSLTIEQPAGGQREFTVHATTRIDRTEFGITAQRGMTGRYLDVSVEVRCVRV